MRTYIYEKSLLILLLLWAFCCNSQSKDEVIFKKHYEPETKYSQLVVQTSHSNMKYSGSKEFLRNLKNKGINNPMVNKKETTTESLIKTGKLGDEGYLPLTMKIVKTTSSDGKKAIPDGTLLYGHASATEMPTFDSLVSDEMEPEFKKDVLKIVQSIFSQLNLNDKKVKIGESFTTETPLSIPLPGVKLDMEITTKYTLSKINNGVAVFKIAIIYTVKSVIKDYKVNATGSGKGKLFYDISNSFPIKYHFKSKLNMNMKVEGIEIKLKTKSGYVQTAVITKT